MKLDNLLTQQLLKDVIEDIQEVINNYYGKILVVFIVLRVFTWIFSFTSVLVRWNFAYIFLAFFTFLYFRENRFNEVIGKVKKSLNSFDFSKKNVKGGVLLVLFMVLLIFKIALFDAIFIILVSASYLFNIRPEWLIKSAILLLLIGGFMAIFMEGVAINYLALLVYFFFSCSIFSLFLLKLEEKQ